MMVSSLRYLSPVIPRVAAKWAEDLFLTPVRVPRPESEKAYFDSAKKYFLKNGIAAYEWGPASGQLVVLVHGWSGRGTQMGAFAEPLVQRGFRVIALDGPAHGSSLGEQTNVGAYAQFLIDAQRELGPFKAVIAHSFGAGCSVVSVSRGLKAEKLVLVAGPSRYAVVVGHFTKMIGLSAAATKIFNKNLAKKVGMKAEDLNIGNIGNSIHVQAMIVHDREDKEVTFASAEDMKQSWPHVRLLATQGLGHRRILKDKNVTEQVAQFISE
ncbi:alpha/beta fold hydrolase [Bdellovibrio sp. HCB2-146]|uniref:alpha/beta fold hydrolase n=1 Tax=Bdellovibrio sp. HCB2-146 TaxID=3394362 RepID=UPI0039BC9BBE